MSKHSVLFDWTPPAAGKDEGEAVRKVAAEIERNVPGYEPPTPISAEDRKELPKSARLREKERQGEHDERIKALEHHEAELRKQERRLERLANEREEQLQSLTRLANNQEKELHESKRRERDHAAAERRREFQAESERRSAAAAAARMQSAQQVQRARDDYAEGLQRVVAGLDRWINPPKPPEPQVVYIESEPDEPRSGALPRLPSWR
jgi:hypothetical protein